MRSFITILLCLLCICGVSQDLRGKWYFINRSGLIEINILSDSIVTRAMTPDLKPKGDQVQVDIYVRTIQLPDRILLISRSKKDTSLYAAETIIDYKQKESFQTAWNGLDTATRTIEELVSLNKNDKRKLYGYYAFSEYYLPALKRLKPIDAMTLGEFKNYATIFVEKANTMKSESARYNTGYLAVTYGFQLTIQSLMDAGFNPIENVSAVDKLIGKYHNDPEVEKIFSRVNKE